MISRLELPRSSGGGQNKQKGAIRTGLCLCRLFYVVAVSAMESAAMKAGTGTTVKAGSRTAMKARKVE